MSTTVLDQFIDQLATAVADKLVTCQGINGVNDDTVADKFMNKGDTAKYLGVSRSTIDRWIKERNFPSTRVGGKYVYKREDVDRWVAEQTK